MNDFESLGQEFWRVSGLIGQIYVRLEDKQITEETMSLIAGTLGETQQLCERIGLRVSVQQAKRIYQDLFVERRINLVQLRPLIADFHSRIVDELHYKTMVLVPDADFDVFTDDLSTFSPQIALKVQHIKPDLSEAGKCLALGRYTACVFHLMRIMEKLLQVFGDAIGVALSGNKNWQNILDEINKKIKALDQKAEQTKRIASVTSHLYAVKLAWRNEVMHPHQNYIESEARAIFQSVKIFTEDLVSIL